MDILDSLTTKAMQYFLNNIVDEFIKLFGDGLVNILSVGNEVLKLASVKNAIIYAQGLALVLLAAKVSSEALQTWILYTHGDSNASPGGLLIRTAKAVAIICSVPWIVSYIYQWGTAVASDVANLSGVGDVVDLSVKNMTNYISNSMFITLILSLTAIIMLLFVYMQTFIRSAELGLLAIIGPLVALNITSTNNSTYSAWIREVIIVSISQALQILMIKTSFYVLAGGIPQKAPAYAFLMFLAWLWVTVKTPKFLKQFAYASGLGGVAGGVVQQAGNAMIMRKVISKGAA